MIGLRFAFSSSFAFDIAFLLWLRFAVLWEWGESRAEVPFASGERAATLAPGHRRMFEARRPMGHEGTGEAVSGNGDGRV